MLFAAVAPNLNDEIISNGLTPELETDVNWLDIRKNPNDLVERKVNSLEEEND